MSWFDTAFRYTMDNEGWDKVTNDPQDPGGRTKYGIAQRFHPAIDIEHLEEPQARMIYEECYWNPMACEDVSNISPALGVKLFDAGVNMGVTRAGKIFQRALNQAGVMNVVEDGRIGPQTLQALNHADKAGVLAAFIEIMLKFYKSREGWPRFGNGWTKRAMRIPGKEVPL